MQHQLLWLVFYDGHAFPSWRGSLFAAALTMPGLVSLSTKGDRVTGEERLLMDEGACAMWSRARMGGSAS